MWSRNTIAPSESAHNTPKKKSHCDNSNNVAVFNFVVNVTGKRESEETHVFVQEMKRQAEGKFANTDEKTRRHSVKPCFLLDDLRLNVKKFMDHCAPESKKFDIQ